MLALISKFSHDMESYVNGARHFEGLIQSVKGAYREFKADIWATAPKYTPYTKAEIQAKPEKRMSSKDFIGELDELREGTLGVGGLKRDVNDLDDVRRHIEAYVQR